MIAQLQENGLREWPADDAIVLVVTNSADYTRAVQQVTQALTRRFEAGVYITANRPQHLLREGFTAAGIAPASLQFIDCVTALTGILPPSAPGVLYVESPTMLEKVAMRAEQMLKRAHPDSRFLVLDSLSTLAVYNGVPALAELTHNMINRLRLQRIPAAFILVERQAGEALLDVVKPLCDAVVRL